MPLDVSFAHTESRFSFHCAVKIYFTPSKATQRKENEKKILIEGKGGEQRTYGVRHDASRTQRSFVDMRRKTGFEAIKMTNIFT
jgi:hypothetical protein